MLRITHLIPLLLISFLSGCTHFVAEDYPQYLTNNTGISHLPSTDKVRQYFLPPQTKYFKYEFRSATSGKAHLWVVEFGKMLDDTLKSADVQAAFGTLSSVDSASAPGLTLVFELRHYRFSEFAAHISLDAKLMNEGTVVFEKSYVQSGGGQAGKMFALGGLAQKNAVHQSTKQALDKILRQLITDINNLQ